MNNYDTLHEASDDLKARGYTLDFNLLEDCIENDKVGRLDPDSFEITEVYRFEGMSNPDDNSVLYVIEGKDGIKGQLVDAYGVYANPLSTKMIEKLRVTH